MKNSQNVQCICFALMMSLAWPVAMRTGEPCEIPQFDRRAVEIRHLNMPYSFEPPASKQDWLKRSAYLRMQVLMSAGLYPLPERAPLNSVIFGKIERGDYSIEKVYFESYPGFLVTGNLYRPLGKKGPFPAILSPHGHWQYGRLVDSELGSVPTRCINLARQGYLVFSYDMVGYNDSRQVEHHLMSRQLSLWGISSLSLQLWNSIRSLDFLESLPDVNRELLACTGESGGGTQTFLLTAVDDRVKFSAPVNMISHYMQGGDVCENTANLRLDTNNMELAALTAPRPMLMVSAAGDWTRDTPRIEFPAIRKVYSLFGAEDKIATEQFLADHNYNKDSREAVYRWFGRWILKDANKANFEEKPSSVEMPSDLLVFYGRSLPDFAKSQREIIEFLREKNRKQLELLKPHDSQSLERFRQTMRPALQQALSAVYPDPQEVFSISMGSLNPGTSQISILSRQKKGDRVPLVAWGPKNKSNQHLVYLLLHPDGAVAFTNEKDSIVDTLSRQGAWVYSVDTFNTGSAKAKRDQSDQFFTTYNRTDTANRIQDILTALAYLHGKHQNTKIRLMGFGQAGLWCLFARALSPRLDATIVDAGQFNSEDDQSYLENLYIPLIRRAGDFKSALSIAESSRLFIYNCGDNFQVEWARNTYHIEGVESALRTEKGKVTNENLLRWVSQ